MLQRLEIELLSDLIDFRKSSNLQGVLFEQISPQYAEKMHFQQRHPYSQYLLKDKDKTTWVINTLDEEAGEEIITPLLENLTEIKLKRMEEAIPIGSKQVTSIKKNWLVKEFYTEQPERIFRIDFITPTAFKQQGKYVIYPDKRLIYQSLMNKYSAVLDDTDMTDEDTLEMLVEGSEIIQYKLRSIAFPMEKITIPAFMGTITVKIHTSDTMANFVRMLFRFGEYSGVGIKTAMGMGAIKINIGGRETDERGRS